MLSAVPGYEEIVGEECEHTYFYTWITRKILRAVDEDFKFAGAAV